MLVKNIILAAATSLGILEKIRDVIECRTPTCQESELLVSCYNLVENEVAREYIPLIMEETFETDTGVIYYSQLSEKAVRILKTQNGFGTDIPCALFPDYLKTQAGKITVRYSYAPKEKTLEDECAFTWRVSENLLVYGVVAEYYLAGGFFEESAVWEKKYKDAVAAAYRAKPAKRISARRWM